MHDLGSVGLDSPDRDPQERGNLLIRFPLGQEADDLCLARSCSRIYPLPWLMLAFFLEKAFQHDLRYFRGEETLALRNAFNRFHKALREIGFQNSVRSDFKMYP